MVDIDSGLLKEWTLLQIEGEEPVKEEVVVDTKVSPAKKSPNKPGAKQVVEEVIDNRPRKISYKKEFAAENGDVGIRFTDQIALKFQKTVMKISIVENDKVIESIQLDLSCMLFPQDKVQVSKSRMC